MGAADSCRAPSALPAVDDSFRESPRESLGEPRGAARPPPGPALDTHLHLGEMRTLFDGTTHTARTELDLPSSNTVVDITNTGYRKLM